MLQFLVNTVAVILSFILLYFISLQFDFGLLEYKFIQQINLGTSQFNHMPRGLGQGIKRLGY